MSAGGEGWKGRGRGFGARAPAELEAFYATDRPTPPCLFPAHAQTQVCHGGLEGRERAGEDTEVSQSPSSVRRLRRSESSAVGSEAGSGRILGRRALIRSRDLETGFGRTPCDYDAMGTDAWYTGRVQWAAQYAGDAATAVSRGGGRRRHSLVCLVSCPQVHRFGSPVISYSDSPYEPNPICVLCALSGNTFRTGFVTLCHIIIFVYSTPFTSKVTCDSPITVDYVCIWGKYHTIS